MPEKKPAKRRSRGRPAYAAVAFVHDPGRRSGNTRVVIEGPFPDRTAAIGALTSFVNGRRFSIAETRVLTLTSRRFVHILDGIRSVLKDG